MGIGAIGPGVVAKTEHGAQTLMHVTISDHMGDGLVDHDISDLF
jgi:hypothetical protein